MPHQLTVDEIFCGALKRPDAADRAAWLDVVCAERADVRAEVERLLAAHPQVGDFLEAAPTAVANLADTARESTAQPPTLGFLSPAEQPGLLGRLDHYDILEIVGSGGFGVVLKARDTSLERIVAIKALAESLAGSVTARKRFVREAKAAAAVRHDNVVSIHSVADRGPVPYLVMEFVAGQSLDERLKSEGPLEVAEILRIGVQTAAGLAAAHEHGLVHRDVKPGNILLENGVQRVKITDFGLARAADDASLTQAGQIAGTPEFMSPEQARGTAIDHRSDLFALGSVLYAMCTGHAPFRASTTLGVLRKVCDEEPLPIRELNGGIPEWLTEIVTKLHAKEPAERFQTAAEVANVLRSPLANLQQPTAAGPRTNLPQQENQSRSPRLRSRWAIAAAILLCVFVGLGVSDATGVTQVVPSVIRIVTGEGTLVVEINDPAVKVTVEGDGGLVISGAGLPEFRLPSGRYQVRAEKDGQRVPLDKERVTISRGGKEFVRVQFEPALKPVGDDGVWVSLFNGHDLSGWKTHPDQPGKWRVEDGVLVGDATGENHLFSQRDNFQDFHLRAEVKINQTGKGAIFFRSEVGFNNPSGKFPLGLEASIYNGPQGTGSRERETETTGSLYWINGFSGVLVPQEDWFTLEVIARGRHIVIKVNGQTTTDIHLKSDDRNRLGHLALMQRSETVIRFRKIEVKELRSGDPVAAAQPFVILNAQGIEVQQQDTLAEAVLAASHGDTIEIRGNGPFVTPPLRITHSLTIRAGEGYRPIIADATLQSEASLVLEGLVLQRIGGMSRVPLLKTSADALSILNCRFVASVPQQAACINTVSRRCVLRNSEFLTRLGVTCHWNPVDRATFVADNCVHAATLAPHLRRSEDVPSVVRLAHNTVIAFRPIELFADNLAGSGAGLSAAFEVSGNIFDSREGVLRLNGAVSGDEANHIRAQLGWQEDWNLYAGVGDLLRSSATSGQAPSRSVLARGETLDAWKQYWNVPNANSLMGEARYLGGDIHLKRLRPELLTPQDFRLRSDSAGYRAGPDGKDLGADIDLVGPGEAYERWKRTPEYQEWLKETGLVK